MNRQIGVSGCFGGGARYEQIDSVDEAAGMVDEIQGGAGAGTSAETGQEYMLTMQQLAGVAQQYARRLRLLTWAVVAIVAYLVAKELKN